MIKRRTLLAASATLAIPAIVRAQVTKLSFYYPIAVGGPIPAIFDGYCRAFQAETGIEVAPVYAGTYGETMTKAVTAIKGGSGPQLAVLLAAEMHSLQDLDILASLDDVGLDAAGRAWMEGFYPAFLANSRAGGKLWSVPFQRSTSIMYYNKSAFTEVGLDPERFPRSWAEMEAVAAKLTRRDATGRVTRWGVKMASDTGSAQWTFGALANQAGVILMNEAGTETYFNNPKATEAMAYWRGLASQHKATPDGVSNWGQLSPDFLEGNAAIIQHTTGNLTNLRTNARFPFGVAGLPGKEGPRTVVGERTRIGAGCVLGADVQVAADCVLHPRVTLEAGTQLGPRARLQSGVVLGSEGFGFARDGAAWIKVPQLGRVRVGSDVEIGANTTVDRGAIDDTIIADGVKLDNQIQIGHNVRIGEHTVIAACVGISGSTRIGARCMIAGAVGIVGHLDICDDVVVTGLSMVSHSISTPGVYSGGIPATAAALWRRLVGRFKRLDAVNERVTRLERSTTGLNTDE